MTNTSYETFFAALSGSRRLEVIRYLLRNESRSVNQIAEATGIEQSAVSRSLNQLLDCQFVQLRSDGKHHYYSLNKVTIVPLFDQIDRHISQFCSHPDSKCDIAEHAAANQTAGV